MHKQTFNSLLSSTCLISLERIVMDLESKVNERLRGSILTRVTFCYWIFSFPRSKASGANIANVVCL